MEGSPVNDFAAPNILLIMTDQQALHAVSAYGAPHCRTPAIDALAADGVRFDRAYTPTALCAPARTSVLTGLLPHNHNVRYNTDTAGFHGERAGHPFEVFPDHLAEMGYRLGWSGKWHAGLAEIPQDIGFEGFSLPRYGDFWNCAEYDEFLAAQGIAKPRRVHEFAARPDVSDPDNKAVSGYFDGAAAAAPSRLVADRAIELLERYAEEDEPFVLICNFWEPHAPYLPAAEFKDLYDPAAIEPWASFDDDLQDRPMGHRVQRRSISPLAAEASWEEWAQAISRYWGAATMVDAEIGRLIAALRATGRYDDTLIVFATDHGESIGIHGGAFDKGGMAYEELYRIPLIVKLPGSAQAGTTREQLVSLIDLAPTFCEAAGGAMTGTDGVSLMPILEDEAAPGREYLVSEDYGHRLPAGSRILWSGEYKYVLNATDIDELYDREADPYEMHNLVRDPEQAALLEAVRAQLLEHLRATGDNLHNQWDNLLTRPADL
jgi:arylsulfatase A-like enzyme